MAKPVRFHTARRRRAFSAKGYGIRPARFRRRRKTWREVWRTVRPWVFGIALLAIAALHQLAGFFEPPRFLQSAPQSMGGVFTRCGPGRGALCVVDGDTFKRGPDTYRVTGIDTAELKAACPAEALQAEASTRALQDWLNRGPFQVTTRIDEPADRYGRTLAIVKRVGEGGREDRLADHMIREGGARSYSGGFRATWC
ncbi:hypothetical protein GRI40_10495 [Altererythrobacter aerius]|uniref:Thermonuclease family protein n=1 Tax=Tsuneonella aeria TaxID=1837929 RepID=A0A6I4THU2_9SPHN|nr:thermonuclease family protein [Tsuneonella aeria]MXO75645.1 hypothetical protein [Tsuneonella aeria]